MIVLVAGVQVRRGIEEVRDRPRGGAATQFVTSRAARLGPSSKRSSFASIRIAEEPSARA
jgi:hypothetical protein